jgi:hypothetical protein
MNQTVPFYTYTSPDGNVYWAVHGSNAEDPRKCRQCSLDRSESCEAVIETLMKNGLKQSCYAARVSYWMPATTFEDLASREVVNALES